MRASTQKWPAALAGLLLVAACTGCGSAGGVYDPVALGQARGLLVMPAVGAPGPDGAAAGPMETGVLITSLARMERFNVQGPGELRKAVAARPPEQRWDPDVQRKLATDLGADLLVLGEVADYRFTKEWHKSSYVIGSSRRTRTTYHAAVNVRLISPADGRVVYAGAGAAESEEGFAPAVLAATDAALADLKRFVDSQKR